MVTLSTPGRVLANLVIALAAILTALVGLTPARAATPPRKSTYTFGVVPQQSATELARTWGPVLDALTSKTGLALKFATAPDIPTFEKRLGNGEYDFAYMNPYHYVVFSKKPGYSVFAKEKDRQLKGIVVVRKDAPFQDLKALEKLTVAFPAPASFAATLLVRAEFAKLGIQITPKFVNSHDSVYMGVERGLFPAGGGVTRTLENFEPAVKDHLRILWTSPGYTPHAIASHPRVSSAVVKRLNQAMLSLDGNAEGKALLEAIGFKGIVEARDAEYDGVRALRIELLEGPVKE